MAPLLCRCTSRAPSSSCHAGHRQAYRGAGRSAPRQDSFLHHARLLEPWRCRQLSVASQSSLCWRAHANGQNRWLGRPSFALHEVQKRAAQAIGFAHWHALASKAKIGWQPTADDIARVQEVLRGEESYPDEGLIGQHPYKLDDVLRDTRMRGRGWCIYIGDRK